MKLIITFLNGTSDAKIQNPVSVTYIIIIYVGACEVNYKIVHIWELCRIFRLFGTSDAWGKTL